MDEMPPKRGFHPTRIPSTGWFKVPSAVPSSLAVPFCTRVSAWMNPLWATFSPVTRDFNLRRHTAWERAVTQRAHACSARAGHGAGLRNAVPDFRKNSRSITLDPGKHANLRSTTHNWPFLVLGFRDKNTGICAGAMPYRRNFPATLPGSRI